MPLRISFARLAALAAMLSCPAALVPAHAAPAAQVALADALAALPMVPPAGPGVFSSQKKGADRYALTVAGHKFTSREAIEMYLAWRAAELTLEQQGRWFSFIEMRARGDSAPVPRRDPAGLRYSFRMEYFRPVWRYRVAGDPAWKSWSPFSGAAFFADGKDPASITDFEASAEIALHKDQMDDADPLAFEAGALSDLLVNQVSPPQ